MGKKLSRADLLLELGDWAYYRAIGNHFYGPLFQRRDRPIEETWATAPRLKRVNYRKAAEHLYFSAGCGYDLTYVTYYCGFTLEKVWTANIEKLKKRYPNGAP